MYGFRFDVVEYRAVLPAFCLGKVFAVHSVFVYGAFFRILDFQGTGKFIRGSLADGVRFAKRWFVGGVGLTDRNEIIGT